MPKRSVHGIFNEFVAALSALIKERVAQSVQTATAEFLASYFMAGQAEEPNKVRRRRGSKPGRKPGPKPAKLSKHGKRIGRPPKAKGE
mgnify:FL=1